MIKISMNKNLKLNKVNIVDTIFASILSYNINIELCCRSIYLRME